MRWILVALSGLLAVSSCKEKEKDYPATDPRLQTRRYCNDPSAVNYNWNFPGVPDNSTCFYGADLFKGDFLYRDSIYKPDGSLDSAASGTDYPLSILRIDSNKIGITGFCGGGGETLTLSAPRIGFRAVFDSTGPKGQRFCRVQDTVSGYLTRDLADSVRLQLFLTLISDTGTTTHRGTAYRR